MFKKLSALVPFLVVCHIALSPSLFAQSEQSHDEFSDLLRAESETLTDPQIQEILEIRKRLGGGTGLELGNLLAPPKSNKDQANDKQAPAVQQLPRVVPFLPKTNDVPPFPAGDYIAAVRPVLSLPVNDVAGYRKIARKMDELAADLEDLNLFEDADLLRVRANRLRLKVRLLPTRFNSEHSASLEKQIHRPVPVEPRPR